jgi:hypothetical protein
MTAGIEASASLEVSLGRLCTLMEAEQQRRRTLGQVIRQIPLAAPQISLTSGAGVLDIPDALAAKTGYNWSVRRLSCNGFTAGTVLVTKNSAAGELMTAFPAAGVQTFGRGELVLNPGERLVFSASGITGFVQIGGAADCLESWYLPTYLG